VIQAPSADTAVGNDRCTRGKTWLIGPDPSLDRRFLALIVGELFGKTIAARGAEPLDLSGPVVFLCLVGGGLVARVVRHRHPGYFV